MSVLTAIFVGIIKNATVVGCRLALAWTQRTRATLTARAIANSRITKEMAIAMTRTSELFGYFETCEIALLD